MQCTTLASLEHAFVLLNNSFNDRKQNSLQRSIQKYPHHIYTSKVDTVIFIVAWVFIATMAAATKLKSLLSKQIEQNL